MNNIYFIHQKGLSVKNEKPLQVYPLRLTQAHI